MLLDVNGGIMINTLILSFILLDTALLVYIMLSLRKIYVGLEYFSDVNYANELLTEFEKEELRKQQAFDERINALKEELASHQQSEKHGTTADELHPLVKNLPHNSIRIREMIPPDVEYAE